MGITQRTGCYVIDSFRDHVIEPVLTAREVVDDEYEEVVAEREAFERFRDRVAGIETVSTPTGSTGTRTLESGPRGIERVRAAFRETVMSVDHYEETYDGSFAEHASAELSGDVAGALQTDVPFAEFYKETLDASIARAIEGRRRYCRLLDAERDSLESNRERLSALLAEFDGPRVPEWYRDEFEARLDGVVQARQETIHGRTTLSQIDGEDLCTYLYRESQWSYPVLTAATRLYGTVR